MMASIMRRLIREYQLKSYKIPLPHAIEGNQFVHFTANVELTRVDDSDLVERLYQRYKTFVGTNK